MRAMRPAGAVGALLAVLSLAAGCGGEEESVGDPATVGPVKVGGGGRLSWALPTEPETIDPLLARSRSARIVSRQIHEPLTAGARPPLGEARRRRGLVVSTQASRDRRVWRVRLRRGVRFQDGSVFNAAAVRVNATRWDSTSEGRRALPGLIGVDAPRPTLARFVFSRSVRDLPERLAMPSLGVVSPQALSPESGEGARLARSTQTGTGAFEIRERRRGVAIQMARNAAWWGSDEGLGPTLDQLRFEVTPAGDERAAALVEGRVQIAGELDGAEAERVDEDPLLSLVRLGPGDTAGVERSVRGLPADPVPALSGVWLTRL